jgi:hypothetical protein
MDLGEMGWGDVDWIVLTGVPSLSCNTGSRVLVTLLLALVLSLSCNTGSRVFVTPP